MAEVKLKNITKKYGDVTAVQNMSLDIPHNEFLVLVGPSGCGKSTTLRMIAGLEEISGGEIFIGVLHIIFSIVTLGLFQLIIPFLYNKQYTTRLLTNGWELNDTEANNQRARLKIGIGN